MLVLVLVLVLTDNYIQLHYLIILSMSSFIIGICPATHKKIKTLRVYSYYETFIPEDGGKWIEKDQEVQYNTRKGIFEITTQSSSFPDLDSNEKMKESYLEQKKSPIIVYYPMFLDEEDVRVAYDDSLEMFELQFEHCLFFSREDENVKDIGFNILFKTIFSDLKREDLLNLLLNPKTKSEDRKNMCVELFDILKAIYKHDVQIDRHFCSKVACLYNFCHPFITIPQEPNKLPIFVNSIVFLHKLLEAIISMSI